MLPAGDCVTVAWALAQGHLWLVHAQLLKADPNFVDSLVIKRRERLWNYEAWQRDLWVKAEAVKLPAGSRVLDAGAGASKYRVFFSHCRYETQDFCRYDGPLVKYVQPIDHVCEITKIPLPDGSLDAILCTEVLEHVADPMAVLAEFGRLVKPGGRLLLTAPAVCSVHMEPYHFYGGFTHYWYRHWLPEHGFQVDQIQPQSGPGRVAVIFLQAYYVNWRTWEQTLRGPKYWLSLCLRVLVAKFPAHYLMPWLMPQLDSCLDSQKVCSGHMVSATRVVRL
jgi:SAM-dependent methyltransferase